MKLRTPSRAGFTLMEIMLVVAIIALLAGLLVYNQIGVLDTGSETAARANMNTIKMNLVTYRMSAGNFPSTDQGLKALVSRPESEPRPLNWKKILDEVPRDPWGREFFYANPGVKHPDSFDLYSAGKDGKPNTEDDVAP
ncbi:MAG: type II secretion system major pseudopilin GspG [Chthoniobacteraceae bacterium]